MKTEKRTKKENSEGTAAFASVPMEKLSGLDETLWLEPMASYKAPKRHKKTKINTKNSK